MKQIMSYACGTGSLFLLIFDVFWYLFKYPDVSSFVAFAMVSGLLAIIGFMMLFIMRMENRLTGFERDLDYFESKLEDLIE